MEPQIAEFIAYASSIAQRRYKQPLPQGVLEKIIDLTINVFDTPIEFTTTHAAAFGRVSTFDEAVPGVRKRYPFFYDTPPKSLYTLTSKYFAVKSVEGDRVFAPTKAFQDDFRYFAQKPTTPTYEAILEELLGLYQSDTGGLKNLVFCTLACAPDGGMSQILADIEIMLTNLQEHIRTEFHLLQPSTPGGRAQTLQRIRSAASGARTKITMLRGASEYHERLSRRTSAYGTRLQLKIKHFPQDTPLWQMARWLVARIERCAIFALQVSAADTPQPAQLELVPTNQQRQHPIDALWDELHAIGKITITLPQRPATSNIATSMLAAFQSLALMADRWIRALAPISDEGHYAQHRAESDQNIKGKPHAVAYDLERGVQMITEALTNATGARIEALRRCRADIGAIPRNWSILFDGKLGPRQGDKDITFFRRPGQALRSMALALSHIDTLRTSGTWEFQPYLRAGIGSGEIIILDAQPQTIELNVAFKAIAASADVDRTPGMTTCSAVMLDDFFVDDSSLAKYRLPDEYHINGHKVSRFNWEAYMIDLLQDFAEPEDMELT